MAERKATIGLSTLIIIVVLVAVFLPIGTDGTSNSTSSSSKVSRAETMTTEEYKAVALDVSYDELKRNPEQYKGKYIVMKLCVVQLVADNQWRTYKYKKGSWTKYNIDEEFYVFDKRKTGTNIIENDVVTVYGVYQGTTTLIRALTHTTEKVPAIDVYLLELGE